MNFKSLPERPIKQKKLGSVRGKSRAIKVKKRASAGTVLDVKISIFYH